MQEDLDVLQIKIEKAREELSPDTVLAINSFNWKIIVSSIGFKNKYSAEQIDILTTETELLLCGLVDTTEFKQELQTRLNISRNQADLLVKDLNDLVFSKIKINLISILDKNRDTREVPGSMSPKEIVKRQQENTEKEDRMKESANKIRIELKNMSKEGDFIENIKKTIDSALK